MDDENVVRCRIGLGMKSDATGYTELTIMGMALYGYTNIDKEKRLGVEKFGATAPLSKYGEDAYENHIVIKETVRMLSEFFEKFDDPLALATANNNLVNEIMRSIDPTGQMNIMEAIRSGGHGYRIKEG